MLPPGSIAEHFLALGCVWLAVLAPGLLLTELLPRPVRSRHRWAAAPLLGVAWWSAALYVLPFRGGMWVAWGLTAAAAGTQAVLRLRGSRPRRCRRSAVAALALVVGALPFLTPVLVQRVPVGIDASRYPTSARLIGEKAGLPDTWAPMAPSVPFGAANHGVSAVAAAAVLIGASSIGAVLAVQQVAFAGAILGVYLLARLGSRRVPAAVVAVAAVWSSFCMQDTISWGGWTTPLCIGMAAFSARLMVDLLRRGQLRGAPGVGILTGAVPLVQGTVAGGWAYVAAPLASVVGLVVSRRRARGLGAAAVAGGVALGVLVAYVFAGRPQLNQQTLAWIQDFQRNNAPKGEGLTLVLMTWAYLAASAGPVFGWLGPAAAVMLLLRRKWVVPAVGAGAVALLTVTIINYKDWFLPGSVLLYPERLVLWSTPLAALTAAAAWRCLRPLAQRRLAWMAAAIVLPMAALSQGVFYQHWACRPVISEASWRALLWCRSRLDPRRDHVLSVYKTAGSYLPAVAGVFSTGCHLHIDQCRGNRGECLEGRPITHVFYMAPEAVNRRRHPDGSYRAIRDGLDRFLRAHPGRAVYDADGITIYELDEPVPPGQRLPGAPSDGLDETSRQVASDPASQPR